MLVQLNIQSVKSEAQIDGRGNSRNNPQKQIEFHAQFLRFSKCSFFVFELSACSYWNALFLIAKKYIKLWS